MRQHVSHYEIIAELDHGPSGFTYLARSESPAGHKVILKTFPGASLVDGQQLRDLLDLLDTLKRSPQPHLVPVLEAGIEEGELYIASEYVTGGSLRVRLDRTYPRTLPPGQTFKILSQIGQALRALHALHMVHGHLKPEHILFDASGQALLANAYLSAGTTLWREENEKAISALRYYAPEQFTRKGDALSDQYAFCCIAYELFTGQTPFPESDPALLQQRKLQEDPAPLNGRVPGLPVVVEEVILRGLARDPGLRYPDMSTMLALLQPSLSAISGLPLPRTKRARTVPPGPSSPEHIYLPPPASPAASLVPPAPADAQPRTPAATPFSSLQGASAPPMASVKEQEIRKPEGLAPSANAPAANAQAAESQGSLPAQKETASSVPTPPAPEVEAQSSQAGGTSPLLAARAPIEEAEALFHSLSAGASAGRSQNKKPDSPIAGAPGTRGSSVKKEEDSHLFDALLANLPRQEGPRPPGSLPGVAQERQQPGALNNPSPIRGATPAPGVLPPPVAKPEMLVSKQPRAAAPNGAATLSKTGAGPAHFPPLRRPLGRSRSGQRVALWAAVLALFLGSLTTYAILAAGLPQSPQTHSDRTLATTVSLVLTPTARTAPKTPTPQGGASPTPTLGLTPTPTSTPGPSHTPAPVPTSTPRPPHIPTPVPTPVPTPAPSPIYELVNLNSGLVLDIAHASTSDGGQVIQWQSYNGPSQHWKMVSAGGGYYYLVNVNSGLALDVPGSSTSEGTYLDQSAKNGAANQQWQLASAGNGYYYLVNRNSGLVLDVPDNSTDGGVLLDQWTRNGGSNQLWSLSLVN